MVTTTYLDCFGDRSTVWELRYISRIKVTVMQIEKVLIVDCLRVKSILKILHSNYL